MIKTPWHSRLAFALALALPVYFAIAALGTKFGLWDWRTGLLTLTIKAGPMLLGAQPGPRPAGVLHFESEMQIYSKILNFLNFF